MTEKRFYLDENGINDREYEFSVLGEDELVDIINGIVDENEELKQQLADIDRLIYDLGHDEMRRQYEEIFKGDV